MNYNIGDTVYCRDWDCYYTIIGIGLRYFTIQSLETFTTFCVDLKELQKFIKVDKSR